MSGIFSSKTPSPGPVPDRTDASTADAELRRRAARTGQSQVLLTAVRDRGNTGQRPAAATLLGG